MSADALIGVKENVLASGMNNYITKPFNPNELFQKLLIWLHLDHKQKNRNTKKKPVNHSNINFPDFTTINIKKGLINTNENKKLFSDILLAFLTDNKNIIDEMQKDYLRNIETAELKAHSLKGTAGTLNAFKVYDASERLELFLRKREKNDEEFNKLLEELRSDLNDCLGEIKYYKDSLKNMKSEQKDSLKIDDNEINLLVHEIEKSIKISNPNTIEQFEKLLLAFDHEIAGDKTVKNKMDEINEKLEIYEFSEALVLFEEVKKMISFFRN